MVRSASAIGATLVIGVLAGCTTTQQKAGRLRLNSARIRATQLPTRVGESDPQVRVSGLSLVRQPPRTALVVTLQNDGPNAVSDLPVIVGYRLRHGRPTYLNTAAGLGYFQSHLPAIAAHGTLRWVLVNSHAVPPGARRFARVGSTATVSPNPPADLPRIRIEQVSGAPHGRLRLRVVNASGVPQFQLPVYAVAERRERLVAAGQTTIEQLGSGADASITLTLIGDGGSRQIAVAAPPTIFR